MQGFSIHPFVPPGDVSVLRAEVRSFLAEHQPKAEARDRANCWMVADKAFSKAFGAAGFLGLTWPKAYGGHERHMLERYVVMEEVLAAGAPVGAHWVADRQTGPLILRYGTEEQKQRYLPQMARGELYACIGLSEPNAGSDLAAVRTSARLTDKGWVLNGQKVWTSFAHECQLMLALVRTQEGSERNAGLSQFLVDLDTPGITIRPIIDLTGAHHFNEVFFDEALLPHGALIGEEGNGWAQATAELALERSGPERYLSSQAVLASFINMIGPSPDPALKVVLGRAVADLWTLRQMSMSVTAKLASGEDPFVEAALVKGLGNQYEQDMPRAIQDAVDLDLLGDSEFAQVLHHVLLASPSFSLRGGTKEILRGIVARGLGLR
jgi:Acyl-CoA dehydrogenase, N-terminal domain/Acyl-CoA dehydrogenase, middle domain